MTFAGAESTYYMSTNSTIGIRNDDGTSTRIYCHWDGYPSHVGAMLLEHHNSEESARALVAGGDCSSLEDDGSVRFYARRSEWDKRSADDPWERVKPQQFEGEELETFVHGSYGYEWRDGAWYWASRERSWQLLLPEHTVQ